MRYKRTRVEKFSEVSRVVCDLCQQPVDRESGWDHSEVTIEASLGAIYPETDTRTTKRADCCVGCWEEKVVPALEALGMKFREFQNEDGEDMPDDPHPRRDR